MAGCWLNWCNTYGRALGASVGAALGVNGDVFVTPRGRRAAQVVSSRHIVGKRCGHAWIRCRVTQKATDLSKCCGVTPPGIYAGLVYWRRAAACLGQGGMSMIILVGWQTRVECGVPSRVAGVVRRACIA